MFKIGDTSFDDAVFSFGMFAVFQYVENIFYIELHHFNFSVYYFFSHGSPYALVCITYQLVPSYTIVEFLPIGFALITVCAAPPV